MYLDWLLFGVIVYAALMFGFIVADWMFVHRRVHRK